MRLSRALSPITIRLTRAALAKSDIPLPRFDLTSLRRFFDTLQSVELLLHAALDKHALPPRKHRYPWTQDIPALATATFHMISLAPELFPWLPFPPAQLPELSQTIEILTSCRSMLDAMTQRIDHLLALYRETLYHRVHSTIDQVDAVIASPTTSQDDAELLSRLSATVRSLKQRRNQSIQRKRRKHRGLAT